jgi:hypothetical protein
MAAIWTQVFVNAMDAFELFLLPVYSRTNGKAIALRQC